MVESVGDNNVGDNILGQLWSLLSVFSLVLLLKICGDLNLIDVFTLLLSQCIRSEPIISELMNDTLFFFSKEFLS